MTHVLRRLAIAITLLSGAVPVAAATPEPAGRYTMSPTEGGFVRLDTHTGTMALCTRKDEAWSCADMPESADASRKRIDQLEADNNSLRDELKRLQETVGAAPGGGAPGGDGIVPGIPGEAPKPFAMPDEKDVDKAFDYIESMIKKFRERVKRLEEKDGSSGTPL